jgi:hypothetical protein
VNQLTHAVKIVKASLSMKVEEELLDQTIEEIAEGIQDDFIAANVRTSGECPPLRCAQS